MIYVGIDVAKETHFAAVMNSDGIVLVEPFAFSIMLRDFPNYQSSSLNLTNPRSLSVLNQPVSIPKTLSLSFIQTIILLLLSIPSKLLLYENHLFVKRKPIGLIPSSSLNL